VTAQPDPAAERESLAPPVVTTSLLDAVRDLRRDVEATRFPLEIPGVESARRSHRRLLDQLQDHLLPRLLELSAPAIVVVAGSTGAGKSTLVNSLLGAEVSQAGVLRPTTRRPVLVHNPDDADLLSAHPLIQAGDVVAHERAPRGIALLDAPDLDSVLASNRESAHRLLEAADLWLFVTTAARYGDALPWRILEGAMERGASIAMVLNRAPADSLPTVRGDLLQRLREHGMHGVPLFVVPDAGPHEGLLEFSAVAPITRWLTMLAGADRARAVIARTLRGSLAALRPWVDELAEAVQAQVDAAETLRAVLAAAAVAPIQAAQDNVLAGSVADGAARARWAELATSGGPLAKVVRGSGRLRGSRRTGLARQEALSALVRDLQRSAETTLLASAAHVHAVLVSALSGPGAPSGGPALLAAWPVETYVPARQDVAAEAARDWVLAADDTVHALLESSDRGVASRATRAVRALGERGLAAVVLAAAAGVERADDLLTAVLPASAADVRTQVRENLAERARLHAGLELAAATSVLDVPDLALDAASTLRLRLAVLKRLT
jgi:hypothetical protein